MLTRLVCRLCNAAKVLLGLRPAEVRFDDRDRWIAELAATIAADAIRARLFDPFCPEPMDASRAGEIVYAAALEAVMTYATFDKVEAVEKRAKRRRENDGDENLPDIPF